MNGRSVILVLGSLMLALTPLTAQRSQPVAMRSSHPSAKLAPAAPRDTLSKPKESDCQTGCRVLLGAVIGGLALGIPVAIQINRSDDAMLGGLYLRVAVGAGALLGAFFGWISYTPPPR